MKLNQWIGTGLAMSVGLGISTSLAAASAPDKWFGLEVKITGESEDDRDLGTRSGGDVQGFGLDLRPWLFGQRGHWSAFAMGQAVTATDTIESDTIDSETRDDPRQRDKHYLALREFWLGYDGFSAYPGEYLRVGRQRLRSDDGTWRDSNIEALNWSFDTTLLRANAGVAQRFSEYRTDLDELAPKDEDRLHLYGDLAYQWRPGHWLGANVHHSNDRGDLRDPGERVDELDKRYTGRLTWLGLKADGDFFNRRSRQPLNYWGQVMWLTGERDSLDSAFVGDQRVASGSSRHDVDAWGLDLGLRWRLDDNWSLGAAYARGSGGGSGDGGSRQFEQTGLHSNRSNFTGTRSRVHRFGEAFRGELSNIQAGTLFASWNLADDYDASLVYHRFRRLDDRQSSGDGGISAALVDGEKDLGQELDLVVTKYFRHGFVPADWGWDEPSTLLRLRAGLFFPGDAYGSQADSTMHRAFIDAIWRF